MAFKSEAHKARMEQLLKERKITQAAFDRFLKAAKGMKLPARATPKATSALEGPCTWAESRSPRRRK